MTVTGPPMRSVPITTPDPADPRIIPGVFAAIGVVCIVLGIASGRLSGFLGGLGAAALMAGCALATWHVRRQAAASRGSSSGT